MYYGYGYGYRGRRYGAGYDADAQAYFDAVTTPFSAARKEIVNDLVVTLKADGNWTKLDRLWLLATEASDQALKSVVNPSSTAMTLVNAPTFTTDRGFTGDAATNYINTNYTPSVDTSQYTLNSASFGVYVNGGDSSADVQVEIGCIGGSNAYIWCRHSSGDAIINGINDAVGIDTARFATATSLGFTVGQRTAALSYELYKNGASLDTNTTDTTTSLPNKSMYVLARNSSDTADRYSARRIGLAYIGSGTINQSTFHTAIQTYMTAIGAQY